LSLSSATFPTRSGACALMPSSLLSRLAPPPSPASCLHLFFSSMIRLPPSSSLFPYTTLFRSGVLTAQLHGGAGGRVEGAYGGAVDRKSTRLNSSHVSISYAVFCLKKKKQATGYAPTY